MKKAETKLHILEKELLTCAVSESDFYDDDTYFDDECFREAYKEFNFARQTRFMYEYLTAGYGIEDFAHITNEAIKEFIEKIKTYNFDKKLIDEVIIELNCIMVLRV